MWKANVTLAFCMFGLFWGFTSMMKRYDKTPILIELMVTRKGASSPCFVQR